MIWVYMYEKHRGFKNCAPTGFVLQYTIKNEQRLQFRSGDIRRSVSVTDGITHWSRDASPLWVNMDPAFPTGAPTRETNSARCESVVFTDI